MEYETLTAEQIRNVVKTGNIDGVEEDTTVNEEGESA